MRGTCLDCVRKHIAQASILMDEAALGYPHHIWLVIGHMAEAESESRGEYPLLAQEIREYRLCIMNGTKECNFDELILKVCKVANEPKYLINYPGNSKQFAEQEAV